MPEEGFLAGLALNNENVTFNDSYKKVLRFYGFDLENDQLPTLPPGNDTASGNSTAGPEKGSEPTVPPMAETTLDQTTNPTREETTANPNAETLSDVDIRAPPPSTMSPTGAANAESTQLPTEATPSMTAATTTPEPSTTQIMDTTTILTSVTPTETSTSTNAGIVPTPPAENSPETTVSESTTTMMSDVPGEPTANNEVDVLTTPDREATNAPSSSTIDTSTMSPTTDASTLTTTTVSGTEQSMTTDTNTTPESTTVSNETTLETLERRKKSVVDFIFTNPPYIDDYLVYRSYDVGLELPIPNFDEKMFLANGLRSVQVGKYVIPTYYVLSLTNIPNT